MSLTSNLVFGEFLWFLQFFFALCSKFDQLFFGFLTLLLRALVDFSRSLKNSWCIPLLLSLTRWLFFIFIERAAFQVGTNWPGTWLFWVSESKFAKLVFVPSANVLDLLKRRDFLDLCPLLAFYRVVAILWSIRVVFSGN